MGDAFDITLRRSFDSVVPRPGFAAQLLSELERASETLLLLDARRPRRAGPLAVADLGGRWLVATSVATAAAGAAAVSLFVRAKRRGAA